MGGHGMVGEDSWVELVEGGGETAVFGGCDSKFVSWVGFVVEGERGKEASSGHVSKSLDVSGDYWL